MASKRVDDVLKELETLGALGAPRKTPPPPGSLVTEVVLERGAPPPRLRDDRGRLAGEALSDAIRGLDALVVDVGVVREALLRLQEVWEPVEYDGEDADVEEDEQEGAPVDAGETEAASPSPAPAPLREPPRRVLGGQDYETARLAAIRKIRGEDLQVAGDAAEDDVPFVGQVRALPERTTTTGEVSLGIIDVKPSLPGGK